MSNKQGEQLTTKEQYKKFNRAILYILNKEVDFDEYLAIMQLMNNIESDVCLVLDNSFEEAE